MAEAQQSSNAKHFLNDALIKAVKRGDTDSVREVIAKGADVNARGPREDDVANLTPLMYACDSGNMETVRLLLSAGANLELKDRGFFGAGSGNTALHYACANHQNDIARLLVKAGANVNAKNSHGETPLLDAARLREQRFNSELVKLLLDAGADVNAQSKLYRTTVLEQAAQAGDVDAVKFLLALGANPNPGGHGSTPLSVATFERRRDVVDILLEAGADAKAIEKPHNFAVLMSAAMAPDPWFVERLLAHGAEPNIVNWMGKSALDLALSVGNEKGVSLLRAAGGKTADELSVAGNQNPPHPPEVKDVQEPKVSVTEADLNEIRNELARLTGYEPEFSDKFSGGFCVNLPSQDYAAEVVEQHQKVFLKKGWFLFYAGRDKPIRGKRHQIILAQTTDQFEVIEQIGTSAGSYGLDTSAIVERLRDLEKEQPFTVTGASFDFVTGRFAEPLRNSRKIARFIYDFCPDSVDQVAGSVGVLAERIRKTRRFELWWD